MWDLWCSWCNYPSLVLRHLEGNGSGTKQADCNPFGSWWEASWPAQTSGNWCPSSSSVTCCLMNPCCAQVWQRGRSRRWEGPGWGQWGLLWVVQFRGGHDTIAMSHSENSSKHPGPEIPPMSGFIVLITTSQEVRLVSLMNTDERFEIWFN